MLSNVINFTSENLNIPLLVKTLSELIERVKGQDDIVSGQIEAVCKSILKDINDPSFNEFDKDKVKWIFTRINCIKTLIYSSKRNG